jgi:hypothetical protein
MLIIRKRENSVKRPGSEAFVIGAVDLALSQPTERKAGGRSRESARTWCTPDHKKEAILRFKCVDCGAEHDIESTSFGASAPLQWGLLSDAERARSLLGPEQCEIECDEGKSYYIRACLDIPITGNDRSFTWGVWCSLSEKSYREVSEHWDDAERTSLGPYFGWLCTSIPGYADSAYLKTRVHQRGLGVRPAVELEPTDHPLAVDQRLGIPMERLMAIVTKLLHQSDDVEPT